MNIALLSDCDNRVRSLWVIHWVCTRVIDAIQMFALFLLSLLLWIKSLRLYILIIFHALLLLLIIFLRFGIQILIHALALLLFINSLRFCTQMFILITCTLFYTCVLLIEITVYLIVVLYLIVIMDCSSLNVNRFLFRA